MLPIRPIAAMIWLLPVAGRAASPLPPPPPAGETEFETIPLAPEAAAAASLVPLKIPGYELRVLDRKKPVRFNVGGVWAESSLPIFIYVPSNDLGLAAGLLRKAHDDLQRLCQKPEWTADELQGVLTHLDAASRVLDSGSSPVAPGAAVKSGAVQATVGPQGSAPTRLPDGPQAPVATPPSKIRQ